ncbi:FecCD family ABC transporter permease [Desulfurobacterium sp.]
MSRKLNIATAILIFSSILFVVTGFPNIKIVKIIRFPQLLTAFAAGSILSMAGVIFQNVLSNPLADPYILGVSAGSALGAVAGYASNINPEISALIGGLLTIAGLAISGRVLESKLKLILFGIGINATLSSLIVITTALKSPEQSPSVLFFLLGFIPILSLKKSIFLSLLPGIFLYIFHKKAERIDALSLGDLFAYLSGIGPERERIVYLTIASLFTAIIVSQTGIIGFIGIVIPHLGRLLKIQKTKELLKFSLLAGGTALILSEWIIKTVFATYDIPAGTVTALVGAPAFIFILWRNKNLA